MAETKTKLMPNNINMLNAMRSSMALSYQDRVPVATQQNIQDIYKNLLEIMPLRSEFATALITQVMYQRIEYGFFENPFSPLKKSPMRYGFTEEEIFINFAKGHTFDMFATEKELYQFYKAEIMSAYHRLSPPIQYPVSVSFDDLRTAFRDEYGIVSLINGKVQSLFNGANWDEYLAMKQLAESAYEAGMIYPVTIPDIMASEANARTVTKLIKSKIGQMKFPHPEYTIAGADSPALIDGIYLLTTPEVDATLDVDVLAYAYDNDYVKLGAHKIIVDSFKNPKLKALLFDMRFYNVRENFRVLSDSKNGAALSWNYFYTVSEMLSYSPFFQIIAFTEDTVDSAPTVELASGLSVAKGNTVTIPVTVNGTEGSYIPKNYRMETVGDTGRTQIIPGSNILYVANDFTGSSVDVVAMLTYYGKEIEATTTVTVNG